MRPRTTSQDLILALGVSLGLHGLLAGYAAQTSIDVEATTADSIWHGGNGAAQSSFASPMQITWAEPKPPEPQETEQLQAEPSVSVVPEEPPAEDIQLGIVDGADVESENILGFTEATEHEAPKSSVNQPQLDPEAGIAAAMPAGLTGQPGLPVEQPTTAESREQTQQAMRETETVSKEAATEPPKTRLIEDQAKQAQEQLKETSDDRSGTVGTDQQAQKNQQDAALAQHVPAVEAEAVDPVKSHPTSRENTQTQLKEHAETREAGEGGENGSGLNAQSPQPQASPAITGAGHETAPGEKSEKQSDATSTEEPTKIRPGRTIAAKGLEIVTRRPEFSKVTRVIAQPGNPTVELTFNREGRVSKATIVKSSGYAEVDQPVLDALYAWRARGEALNKLPRNDQRTGVTLKFTVILN